MANTGFVESLLGGLQADLKRVLTEAFRYALSNGRFGSVDHQAKSESFQAYFLVSTTASDTGEFSIVHGLGRAPYYCHAVLPLNSSAYTLPVLRTTRPADASRLYLQAAAGSTNLTFALLVE